MVVLGSACGESKGAMKRSNSCNNDFERPDKIPHLFDKVSGGLLPVPASRRKLMFEPPQVKSLEDKLVLKMFDVVLGPQQPGR